MTSQALCQDRNRHHLRSVISRKNQSPSAKEYCEKSRSRVKNTLASHCCLSAWQTATNLVRLRRGQTCFAIILALRYSQASSDGRYPSWVASHKPSVNTKNPANVRTICEALNVEFQHREGKEACRSRQSQLYLRLRSRSREKDRVPSVAHIDRAERKFFKPLPSKRVHVDANCGRICSNLAVRETLTI